MMQSRSYRIAFAAALMLHISVAMLLLSESSTDRPAVSLAAQNEATPVMPIDAAAPQEQAIRAVSVDSQEVMKTVNRLKQERLREKQAEVHRQQALTQQADAAQKRRIEEQKHLEKLKNESAKLAIAHKKELEEEQRLLKQLTKQKQEEEKHLADMKQKQLELQKKQQEEASKLAELKKKKSAELARANQERDDKLKTELEQRRQAALQQAAADAQRNSQIAGEVDKYKALIIGAISRQWILPENVDGQLSSQFRIRLAPNGAVLEVSLARSSGDPILDRSAQSAIYKASPLPVPNDPEAFNVFRDITLTVRPQSFRG